MSLTSIIIPARNEQENIIDTVQGIVREFDQNGFNYEIIVVDDGSTDQTGVLVLKQAQQDDRIRLVRNAAPHGIGNAINCGLQSYNGDYVIIAMADASDDPRDMIRYVREVEKGVDCCFGSRWIKGATVKDYPKVKLFVNRLANWFVSVLFRIKYNDVTNAFKCYSRQSIEGIKPVLSHHFNITVELPLKAIVRGYTYTVIPTNWRTRTKGKTSLKIKEMGSRYLFIILYVFLEKLLCKQDYHKK